MPDDIPPGGTQRGSEGVLKGIKKGCASGAGFASLLGKGPQNGTGIAEAATFRKPSGRVVTLEEHIRQAEVFGFGDNTLARSFGVTVEAIQAERRKMAEQTSEAMKEITPAGGNGDGPEHPDQTYPDKGSAEIVVHEATSAAVGATA